MDGGGDGTASSSDTSFDASFDRLYAVAYRVAFRLTGSREESDDIAQESLARASARWSTVAGYAEAWVATVSGNLAISYWRARRRRESAAPGGQPAGTTAFLDERLDLVRALRRLPRRQRGVVVLRYLADWSEADVAAHMGCSVGSVKSQASRGLAILRRSLDIRVQGPEAGVHFEGGDL